uniref:Uncharacterized protein n=2 Tax=Euplotes harpa TaxID=151035 RepID=A0A7S3J2E6_9SPIT|mmetsp:Transcript_15908/g.18430  ORF Transcript_15908/g.18430 Transcript_15908/m.18430 type:complete len:113 (+) Transcript_15908:260-598(+)
MNIIRNAFNMTLLIPSNMFKFLDDSATFINRYSLWQGYCMFGTMFTKLDNAIETFEGITGVFYKIILNYATMLIKIGNFSTAYSSSKCRDMFKAVGEIFKLAFDFVIPDDIV